MSEKKSNEGEGPVKASKKDVKAVAKAVAKASIVSNPTVGRDPIAVGGTSVLIAAKIKSK